MSRVLRQVSSGVVTATGACSISFTAPPDGSVYTGSVSVPTSPPGTAWQVSIGNSPALGGGTPWHAIQGATATPVQLIAGEVLTLAGAGLVPTTSYQAILTGLVEADTSPTQPPALQGVHTAGATGTEVALLPYGPQTIPAGGVLAYTFPLPRWARALSLSVLAGADLLYVEAGGNNSHRGTQCGFGPGNSTTLAAMVNPTLDTQVVFTATGTVGDTFDVGLVANSDLVVVQAQPAVTPVLTDFGQGLFTLAAAGTKTVYTNTLPAGAQFLQSWRLAVAPPATAGVYDVWLTLMGEVIDHVVCVGGGPAVNDERRILNGQVQAGDAIVATAGTANPAPLVCAFTAELTNVNVAA